MENKDEIQSSLIIASANVTRLPPNEDEGCIVLDADVYDEVAVDIEEAVVCESVVVEATAVVVNEQEQVEAVVVSEIQTASAPPTADIAEIEPVVAQSVSVDEEVIQPAWHNTHVVDVEAVDVEEIEEVSAQELGAHTTSAQTVQIIEVVESVTTSEFTTSELIESQTESYVEPQVLQAELVDDVATVATSVVESDHNVVVGEHDSEAVQVIDADNASQEMVTGAGELIMPNMLIHHVHDEVNADELSSAEVVEIDVETSTEIEIDMGDDVNTKASDEERAIVVNIDMNDVDEMEALDTVDKDEEPKAGSTYLQTEVAPSVQQTNQDFAPTTPPTSNTSTAPTLDVSSDTIHKTPAWFPSNFAKPVLFLAGSSVLGVWIMQQSINAYFLQTYHKPSPLANIDNGLWKAGAKIHDALLGVKEGASDVSETAPTNTTQETQTFTPNGMSETNGEVNTDQTTAQTPTQPSKEELIKASLTLNNTHKVFFAGDSLMQGVAPHIQKQLQQSGVQSVNLSKQSTGLAYPKFFDWPTTIKNTIAKDKSIKVLVIMLGPNDPWDMPVKGGGQYLKFESPEWNAEYQARMADILNFAKDNQVGVIWVTPPNMKKQKLDTQMMYISNVMAEELARHEVQVLDARPIMGSVNNQYNDYVEKDGKKVKMRTGDGIHFTPDGQRALAQSILSLLHIEPATPANSVAPTAPITPVQP